jgi:hypothetical protein
MNKYIITIILISLLLIALIMVFQPIEGYKQVSIRWPKYPPPREWIQNSQIIWPWWLPSSVTRFPTEGMTTNMSYDIRGDPFPIPRYYTGPWNNSSLSPIYNRPLELIS